MQSSACESARSKLAVSGDTFPVAFERVVLAHAARIAVSSDTWKASYAELNATANGLAHALIATGGSPGDRIAILMDHDSPQIAALLAVLKAGGVAVILNPRDPPLRHRQVLEDAGASIIIADSAHAERARAFTHEPCVVVPFDASGQGPSQNPDIRRGPNQMAMLVYTSGSTGQPKGVIQTHRQLLNLFDTLLQCTDAAPTDRIALFGALSGRQGTGTTSLALLCGATLYPFPVMDKGIAGLTDWMQGNAITIYVAAASLFRHFAGTLKANECFPHVRVVRLASEPATAEDFKTFKQHFPADCAFVHTLSSSEIGNYAQVRLMPHDVLLEGRVPVGNAPDGVVIRLVGDDGREVLEGEPGEIVVRSPFISDYWSNATASERHDDASTGLPPTREFHTGDLGRINEQGLLVCLGRKDDRLKIRGYRIELGEIEAAIMRLPDVKDVFVCALDPLGKAPELVAYVCAVNVETINSRALRQALRARLPPYMLPKYVVPLEEFPRTPYGKIDRVKLRETIPDQRDEQRSPQSPQSETEALLARLWGAAFERPEIDREDDFFDLGGDSLLAAVVGARLHDSLGIALSIGTFFDHPRLADLARIVDGLRADKTGGVPAPRASRDRPFPLSFGQEFYWEATQSQRQSLQHVIAYQVRIVGDLKESCLRECLSDMIQRHEILRTSFHAIDGRPVQQVSSEAPLSFEYFDLSGFSDPRSEADRIRNEAVRRPMSIERLPLIHFTLLRIGADEHWLLTAAHHILLDGWSLNIFFRELGKLYEARLVEQGDSRRGEPDLTPPRQYGDYALWQRETFRPAHPGYQVELSWWVDRILASVYPEQAAYLSILTGCMRRAPRMPRIAKNLIGLFLRGIFLVRRPAKTGLDLERARVVKGLDPAEGVIRLIFAPETSRGLNDLGRRESASHFTVRLAAYAALVAFQSGNPSVVFSTYFSTRSQAVAKDVFGFCANHALLILHCDPTRTFRQFIGSVREHLRAVQSHGDFPYEILSSELRAWRIRVPQSLSLVSIGTPHPDVAFAGLRLTAIRDHALGAMPSGLDVKFDRDDGDDACMVTFDAHRYDPTAVRALAARFSRVLDVAARDPDISLADVMVAAAADDRGG